ncbi:hypothetical protein DFH09DRAFT_1367053 [Mycena vulgaris]|nr:hypothetical protein DFH09DRAFT_1367053 [Mycena vulgaris]
MRVILILHFWSFMIFGAGFVAGDANARARAIVIENNHGDAPQDAPVDTRRYTNPLAVETNHRPKRRRWIHTVRTLISEL